MLYIAYDFLEKEVSKNSIENCRSTFSTYFCTNRSYFTLLIRIKNGSRISTVRKPSTIAGWEIFSLGHFPSGIRHGHDPLDLGRRSGIFNSSLRVIKLGPRGGRSTVTLQANCGFVAVKIKISSLTSYKGEGGESEFS